MITSLWWVLTNFIIDSPKDLRIALFLSRMAIIGPILIAPLALYFSIIFPKEKIKLYFWKMFLIFTPPILLIFFSPTKFNVEKVWLEEWGINFKPGALYYFLIIYLVIYFALIFKNLLNSYKKTVGVEKMQIIYVFTGFFLALIIGTIAAAFLPVWGYSKSVILLKLMV